MSGSQKTFRNGLAAAGIALAVAALSTTAEARSGENFDRHKAKGSYSTSAQASKQVEQRAADSAVFSDAVLNGRPEGFGIQRRKWSRQ